MTNENRYFKDHIFVSTSLPEISLRFPKSFIYLGQTAFILYQIAQVDRHHFLKIGAEDSVRQIIILHFESFLPETDNKFHYRVPDPPDHAGPDFRYSLEKVNIGKHEYIHNTWFFDAETNIRENPDGELIRSAKLFNEHGYTLPKELQMSRYVRVVDAMHKSELILFYMEPLGQIGYKVGDFVEGGRGEKVFEKLSAQLTDRSYEVFARAILE